MPIVLSQGRWVKAAARDGRVLSTTSNVRHAKLFTEFECVAIQEKIAEKEMMEHPAYMACFAAMAVEPHVREVFSPTPKRVYA